MTLNDAFITSSQLKSLTNIQEAHLLTRPNKMNKSKELLFILEANIMRSQLKGTLCRYKQSKGDKVSYLNAAQP